MYYSKTSYASIDIKGQNLQNFINHYNIHFSPSTKKKEKKSLPTYPTLKTWVALSETNFFLNMA